MLVGVVIMLGSKISSPARDGFVVDGRTTPRKATKLSALPPIPLASEKPYPSPQPSHPLTSPSRNDHHSSCMRQTVPPPPTLSPEKWPSSSCLRQTVSSCFEANNTPPLPSPPRNAHHFSYRIGKTIPLSLPPLRQMPPYRSPFKNEA